MSLLSKKWTEEEIAKYIGDYQSAYIGYAEDDMVRLGAASGGAVSALLIYALGKKNIDGAVVCRTYINDDGKVRNHFVIAKNKGDILAARGSAYVATGFVSEVFKLIEGFTGRLAVVGLPCDLMKLARWGRSHPKEMKKVTFTIALFCGHCSLPELVDKVTAGLSKTPANNLETFRFRVGRWRGKILARYADGVIEENSFGLFGLYQNLYFFCHPKCLHCVDLFGYHADICAGDLWDYRYKKHPIKHNSLICKTKLGQSIVLEAMHGGALYADKVPINCILDGQRRIVRSHHNVSARSKVGKKLGIHIRDTAKMPVSWHDYLVAWIQLFNYRWSQSRSKNLIFRVPKVIMKLYLFLLKGLESLS